ncbi:sialidase family protein [Plantactinospora sp. KLBMP9567]|uniref:sialidase family protein n=1 Tax=Plantactinospora sp. KLBMP9567 TaxID=3085900 RepID=UPI002981169B|nr:sialidase family protein [Plantactinospora sp. KLBMP9567]MDW5328828.1 sialidase family protein [Plantactinospora sp. KLBMP9567]
MTIHRRRLLRRPRYRAALLAVGMTAAAALTPVRAAADATVAATDPLEAKTAVLFSTPYVPAGCYRIPAIVRAVDGSLLAFAERRIHTCADKSHMDLVVRRLPAGATQWLPAETVLGSTLESPATWGNPGPVVYRKLPGAPATSAPDGRIVMMSTHNPVDPATPGKNHEGYPRTPYLLHSDDNGVTWSPARSLYEELDDPSWGHMQTAPVHGIQLTRGAHAGRLAIGVNYRVGSMFGLMIAYSDDGGTTWHKGAQVEYPPAAQQNVGELSLVELANGDILVWGRQNTNRGTPEELADPNVVPHRSIAISKDGGETYHSGYTNLPGFEAPPIQSASLRTDATDEGDAYDRILVSAPSVNQEPRIRPTVRASFDEGRTWQGVDTPLHSTDEGVQVYGTNDRSVPVEECACYGGYSDMVELPGGEVGLLYERGTTDYRSEIAFVRLNDRDLHTPSTTVDVRGRSALVFDGVTTTHGVYGRALAFDGQRGRIQLPYRTTPVLGSGDFTVSTWVRYDDDTRDQAIFWAYGQDGEPQVWLRAEPGSDRIRGMVTTVAGSVAVTSDGAYADGRWHHVALRRQRGTVALFVDGVRVDSGSGAAGAVHGGDPTPIYLGQRPDGANRFHGRMDEFRIYDRALSTVELTWLRISNTNGIPGRTAHLPMNAVIPSGG